MGDFTATFAYICMCILQQIYKNVRLVDWEINMMKRTKYMKVNSGLRMLKKSGSNKKTQRRARSQYVWHKQLQTVLLHTYFPVLHLRKNAEI